MLVVAAVLQLVRFDAFAHDGAQFVEALVLPGTRAPDGQESGQLLLLLAVVVDAAFG